MNTNLNNICDELHDLAQSLKQDVARMLKESLPQTCTLSSPDTGKQSRPNTHVSNPERPWIVAGGSAVVVGVLGAIFSWGNWSYVLGSAGLVSIIYGQNKKKRHEKPATIQPIQSFSEPKSYELAEKMIDVSKMVETKWRDKVEECKVEVQRIIEASSVPAELADSLMSQTYTTERISIDFDAFVSRLESSPASLYSSILSEYERNVNNCIEKAASEQIAIYKTISQSL